MGEYVVPVPGLLLCLTGGAFAAWSQLPTSSHGSLAAVHNALYAAFALDQYAAYKACAAYRLQPIELADVFLADFRGLSALFGGIPECTLTCALVVKLPEDICHTIHVGSRAKGLDLTSVVAQTHIVLREAHMEVSGVSSHGCSPITQKEKSLAPLPAQSLLLLLGRWKPHHCWSCG